MFVLVRAVEVARAGFFVKAKYDANFFVVSNVDAASEYFVSNVRLAVGAPDTGNKLLTEGCSRRSSPSTGRPDTHGKGEAEPIEKNETPAGKADNRRVEFIRRYR